MASHIVRIPTDQIARKISDFTIGLAKLSVHGNVEDAICAGSGTLVTVGRLEGLLTAAHVLDVLPKGGEVGIVLYTDGALQKQVIRMENTESIKIGSDPFGPNGPDLGFLRLPEENIGWLKATNSFLNLSKRREAVLAKHAPAASCVDAVIGLVDKLTKEVPVDKPLRRAKAFSALFCDGHITSERNESGYDILDVAITEYPDFPLPASFEGMSGGGLWRIYFSGKEGHAEIVDQRLLGVPFFETTSNGVVTKVTCHGPESIYGSLHDKAESTWPTFFRE